VSAPHGPFAPAPRPILETGLSSSALDAAAKNAATLYDTCRSFPGLAQYAHANGGTYAYAQQAGVLGLEYGQNYVHPTLRADFFKVATHDTLVLTLAYLAPAGGAHRIDVRVNGTLATTFTANATTLTVVPLSFNVGVGNGFGIADGSLYTVVVYATDLNGTSQPFRFWLDEIYATPATIGMDSYAALPTFTGASIIDPSAVQQVLDRQQTVYNRLAAFLQPGFSGLITGFMDSSKSPDLTNVPIRHFHYSCRVLPGRRLWRISGRQEGRSDRTYTLTLTANGVTFGTESRAGRFVAEPWDPVADLSGLSLTNGSYVRTGVDYTLTSAERYYPRPRICLFDWSLTGADSSPLYAHLPPLVVDVDTDYAGSQILAYLQQLRDNTAAMQAMYTNAAPVLDRSWPWISQWNTSARWMFHPGVDPDDIERKEENPVDGPACFVREGDLLHVCAVRPRIVWGPQLYEFEQRLPKNGQPPPAVTDEIVEVRQPFEYVIDDDPDKAIFRTVDLGTVSSNGARLTHGERFRLVADRIIYCAQQRYPIDA
jgi:hypothetical protein